MKTREGLGSFNIPKSNLLFARCTGYYVVLLARSFLPIILILLFPDN